MKLLNQLATYRFSRYFKLCFLIWDVVLLNAAIVLSFLVRYDSLDRMGLKEVQTVSLLSNVFWILLLIYNDSYRIIRIERIENILLRMIKMMVVQSALIAGFVLVLKYSEISRLRILYFYVIFFMLLFVSRIVFMKVIKIHQGAGL